MGIIMKWHKKILVGFGLIMLFLAGCAPPMVKMSKLEPAKYNEVAKLKRIAVMPFTEKTRKRSAITADVQAAIASVQLDGKPYFQVVERTHLEKILDEQRLGRSGLVDNSTAAKIGRLAGVQAVVMGTVAKNKVDKIRHSERRKYCTKFDAKGRCNNWAKRTVRCETRTATFRFIPKIVDTTNARMLMSEAITEQEESVRCDKERAVNDSDLLMSAKQAALSYFTDLIAPHYRSYDLALITEDNSNPSKIFHPPVFRRKFILSQSRILKSFLLI